MNKLHKIIENICKLSEISHVLWIICENTPNTYENISHICETMSKIFERNEHMDLLHITFSVEMHRRGKFDKIDMADKKFREN